jgi:hypothetical protein
MLSAHYAVASTYRVEVSGWDKNQAFFVEKSELEWSEEFGKQLLLSWAIPDGAVVFLHLIATMTVDRSDPVPYETEFMETTLDGFHQFRLQLGLQTLIEKRLRSSIRLWFDSTRKIDGLRRSIKVH